jgi:hypothetical protein
MLLDGSSRVHEMTKGFLRSLTLTLVMASMPCLSQTAADPQSGPTTSAAQIPLRVLYRHYMAYQNHLDRAAAVLDKAGKNGDALRTHFQKKLGFTDTQFQLVRDSALRLEAALKDQDAKAKALIDATRAKVPSVINGPADLPPVPPELIDMQKQRDALIDKEIDALKKSLGPSDAAKLDTFLQYDFAPSVTVQSIGPPRPQDPAIRPINSFSQVSPQ